MNNSNSIIIFSIKRGLIKLIPVLLIIFILFTTVTMASPIDHTESTDTIKAQLLTVVDIVSPYGKEQYYVISFYESARLYKLMTTNKNCTAALRLLNQSKKNKQQVQVFLTQNFGDIIYCVKQLKR